MKHPLRRRWLFIAFLGLRATARWLPLSLAQALGGLLGYIAYGLLGRYRALSWEHLRYAFGPAASTGTRHRIARGAFINLGKTVIEWFVLERLSPTQIRRLVDIHGVRHLARALSNGRGAIALSGHFGNWELLATALANQGFEGGVLARRLRYPEYERFLWTIRERQGVKTYYRGSVKEIGHVLRTNQIIGMMPDQDIDSLEGVFVDFFSHPAYTPVGPAALSLLNGTPILPCFIIRNGLRFRIVIEEPIPMTRSERRSQDLIEITQTWSRMVESYIRCYPDHWVWMHRRWKTKPETIDFRPNHTTRRQVLQPASSSMLLSAVCCLLSVAIGCGKPAAPRAHAPTEADTQSPAATTEETSAQKMSGFTMVGYAADGTKRWELEGTGASVEGTMVTIHHPDAIGYEPGRTSHLTARLAQVDQTSRRVRLEHEVTIHSSDGLWLTSPLMYWLPDRSELVTEDPVRLESAHMLLRGRGATGHTQLKTAVILRDVELVLNPTTDPAEGRTEESPERRSHVTITCDGPLAFDYERHIATFEQNVHVQDRQGDLYSDRLIAYLDKTTRTITYAEAIGQVRIVQGPHTATSERAVYEPAIGKITLLGSPALVVYPEEGRTPRALSLGGAIGSPPTQPQAQSDPSAATYIPVADSANVAP